MHQGKWVLWIMLLNLVWSVTVVQAQGPPPILFGATVHLTWTPPATNADGSPLSPLSAYQLYQGTQSQVYGPPSPLPADATTTAVVGLQPGTTYYFALTAVSSAGESAKSNEIAAQVPALPQEAGLRVNIQDYGAVPDDAGDDAPAIRDAISAVIAAGGGTVVIPPGGWHIPGVLAPALLPVVSVTALSALPEFAPRQTLDHNMGTRWAAEGLGQWIQYDLGQSQTLTGVEIAWYQGHTAQTQFGVRASEDGVTWQDLYQGTSSGTSTDFERVLTGPVRARYVQIVGHGTAAEPVTSISEVRLLGTVP